MKNILRSASVLLLLLASPAVAQDVLQIGRQRGVEPPAWVKERLARDPNAFEFERAWKSSLERALRQRANLRARGIDAQAFAPARSAQAGAAVAGDFRMPVFMVRYANTPTVPYQTTVLQDRLFATSGAGYTLTTFYRELSRSIFNLSGTVYGWYQVPGTAADYEGDDNGRTPPLIGQLLKDVLDQADETIDFRQFDRDGDGFVDVVAIVHPTAGGECGGRHIWSHRWTYASASATGQPYLTNDGVFVNDYIIQPALDCDQVTPVQIGVFAHELGHALGLPDLYATDRSSSGVGVWDLMGAGNWNQPESPAHMGAWSKALLGWIPEVMLTGNRDGLVLESAIMTGVAYRINVPAVASTRGEYFLLENRQRHGADMHLPAPGLLIWHIDSTAVANRMPTNTVQNDPNHMGVYLVQADGRRDLDLLGNQGDPGDPYPGSTNNTTLDATSVPNSNTHTGTTSGIALHNIRQSGLEITLDLTFGAPGERIIAWGDVDQDGMITHEDMAAIYRGAVGLDPGMVDLRFGDVDADGLVGVRDGYIIQVYVELGPEAVSRFRIGRPASAVQQPAQRLSLPASPALRPIPIKTRRDLTP